MIRLLTLLLLAGTLSGCAYSQFKPHTCALPQKPTWAMTEVVVPNTSTHSFSQHLSAERGRLGHKPGFAEYIEIIVGWSALKLSALKAALFESEEKRKVQKKYIRYLHTEWRC